MKKDGSPNSEFHAENFIICHISVAKKRKKKAGVKRSRTLNLCNAPNVAKIMMYARPFGEHV